MDRVKEPTEGDRAAQPGDYWFHTYDGYPRYLWGEWDVTEDEYRRHASREDIAFVDDVLKRHFGK